MGPLEIVEQGPGKIAPERHAGGQGLLRRQEMTPQEVDATRVVNEPLGIDTVVEAMQSGATDFFVKPASPERVVVSINNALNISTLKGEVSRLKRKRDGALAFASSNV